MPIGNPTNMTVEDLEQARTNIIKRYKNSVREGETVEFFLLNIHGNPVKMVLFRKRNSFLYPWEIYDDNPEVGEDA